VNWAQNVSKDAWPSNFGGFSICFDFDRVLSSSEELEPVELSSEFDSQLGVRFFLVLLLRDTLRDALRSSLRLDKVLRLCLVRVKLLDERWAELALEFDSDLVRLFDRFEFLDERFAFVSSFLA